MNLMGKTYKDRDNNIRKSYQKEIDLNTKVVKSKKDYKRKPKYKGNDYE